MNRRVALVLALAPLLGGCASEGIGGTVEAEVFACTQLGPGVPLPEVVREASGVAWSTRHPGVIWVINDGNDGRLFAVDTAGALLAEIPFDVPTSIARVWDMEDMAIGPCDGGDCLYLADVGDNYRIRDTVDVYRAPEPALDAATLPLERFPMIHGPEGRVDIETLLLAEGERVYLLTKGNEQPPSLLRFPGTLPEAAAGDRIGPRTAEARTLEEVHRLDGSGRTLSRQFTGGARIPGTDRWMIRTYSSMAVYRIEGGLLLQVEDTHVPLGPLREPQGEAIAVRADGKVVLASEAGPFGRVGGLNFVQCEGLGGG